MCVGKGGEAVPARRARTRRGAANSAPFPRRSPMPPAAKRVLDDGESAPPGGTAEAGAAATGLLDDGERSAMTRELVAKLSPPPFEKAEQVEQGHRYNWEQGDQLPEGVGSRHGTLEGGNGA